ncbi:MAG: hypothetical protein IPO23_08770 [Flavobacterium sp.]|nr:hypothetical protein [Flavobacterium sp.]
MHHFDIQKIGDTYYYVYDGNRLENTEKIWNIKGALKMNYCDFKNWWYQNFN